MHNRPLALCLAVSRSRPQNSTPAPSWMCHRPPKTTSLCFSKARLKICNVVRLTVSSRPQRLALTPFLIFYDRCSHIINIIRLAPLRNSWRVAQLRKPGWKIDRSYPSRGASQRVGGLCNSTNENRIDFAQTKSHSHRTSALRLVSTRRAR